MVLAFSKKVYLSFQIYFGSHFCIISPWKKCFGFQKEAKLCFAINFQHFKAKAILTPTTFAHAFVHSFENLSLAAAIWVQWVSPIRTRLTCLIEFTNGSSVLGSSKILLPQKVVKIDSKISSRSVDLNRSLVSFTDLDQGSSKMFIFGSIFEASFIFWGSWGSSKYWLEHKIEPP